ncbi:MmcQ/YjbR family DNA-binding protein [Fusobacterium sp.]|uniref:MmcQ/YjbR family DNA-binding protein n=1 Tax=Fusobacterium sp. TaxID=68766 RepID=UPI002901C51E|nr:MmcQ/YjbR family DNA-binding protein [Fusobacterium sp.]MDU1910179.1 MmcQ/YjbR family DNA-binding protein [Fusobacterium sp.]
MLYQGKIFNNRKFIIKNLLSYGFTQKEKQYIYSKNLMNDTFNLIINIKETNEIDIKIIDTKLNEEYTLIYIQNISGGFVGKIRKEYEEILIDIAEKCTKTEIFKSGYAKKIVIYIAEKYKDSPEYLWPKTPNNAVFRDKSSEKWYAALLEVEKRKVGIDEDGVIEIIDLKAAPDKILSIVDNVNYLPGYHMNKKHWFTIKLDGSIPIKTIYLLIDESFNLVKKKR